MELMAKKTSSAPPALGLYLHVEQPPVGLPLALDLTP